MIAAITNCLPEVSGHRLVITPWDALVRQLIGDLRERFCGRLPQTKRPTPLPVKRLPAASRLHSLGDAEPTIDVATIAAISVAAADHGTGLGRLFADIGCVIVDEGHYEPADNWSEAIRSLERPSVLLTATPYRNDHKFFRVNNWQYRFPHHEAKCRGYLRVPSFDNVPSSGHPTILAENIIQKVNLRFADPQNVRIIVRCATTPKIIEMVRTFRGLGESAIGVHETFTDQPGEGLLRAVPATDSCNARVWIHQNKLIEGIDDPRFKALASFDPLHNGRAIVQQIGRVLRRPKRRDGDDKNALVLTREDRRIKQAWENYRLFDKQDQAGSAATLPDLVKAILAAQRFYHDGAYRSPIDLSAPKPWEQFAFPLRTRVFHHTAGAMSLSRESLTTAALVASASKSSVLQPNWRIVLLCASRCSSGHDTAVGDIRADHPSIIARSASSVRTAVRIEDPVCVRPSWSAPCWRIA